MTVKNQANDDVTDDKEHGKGVVYRIVSICPTTFSGPTDFFSEPNIINFDG